MSAAALVLAAGESTRMKRPKPLLSYEGEPFLEHILRVLGEVPSLDARLAVLGHEAPLVRRSVHFHGAQAFTFRGYRRGMLASLKAGAAALLKREPDCAAVLVCLVDHPRVEATTYERLLDAFNPSTDDVVVASYGGQHGHPIVLGRRFLEGLLADRSSKTLADYIEEAAQGRRYLDCDDPGVVDDINSPDAYEAIRKAEPAP